MSALENLTATAGMRSQFLLPGYLMQQLEVIASDHLLQLRVSQTASQLRTVGSYLSNLKLQQECSQIIKENSRQRSKDIAVSILLLGV